MHQRASAAASPSLASSVRSGTPSHSRYGAHYYEHRSSMTKRTPAPWILDPESGDISGPRQRDGKICQVLSEDGVAYLGRHRVDEALANAALLCQAPGMFAWIEQVCTKGLSFEDILEGRKILTLANGQ